MYIPKRLVEIANLVEDGSYVADIGADHGLLEILLSTSKPNTKVFAVENKKGPYKILSQKVEALKNITVSLSNGIREIPDEVDTLVIAGMGGMNIISILNRDLDKLANIKTIILDAHRNIPQTREKLNSLCYAIKQEKLIHYNGIYYNIILFNKINGVQKLSKSEIEIGYNLSQDPIFENYKNHLIKQRQKVISKITNLKQIEILKSEIERIENYGKDEVI